MKKLFVLALLFMVMGLSAQVDSNKKNINLKEGSVKDKFDAIYTKSGRYKEYKVVKAYLIPQLKKIVLDSLQKEKDALKDNQAKIASLNEQIKSLESQLQSSEQNIAQLQSDKDHISFLGMPVSKRNYSITMWVMVGLLLSAFLFFVYKFNNSNKVTQATKIQLQNLENEFNEFRTSSIEREQLLKRQLLDERKKHQ